MDEAVDVVVQAGDQSNLLDLLVGALETDTNGGDCLRRRWRNVSSIELSGYKKNGGRSQVSSRVHFLVCLLLLV